MSDSTKLDAAALTDDQKHSYEKKVKVIQKFYREGRFGPATKKIRALLKKYTPTKEHATLFALIQQESQEVQALLDEFSKDEGWEKVSESGDSTCKFRNDPHSPTKTIFIDGKIDTNLFNLIAVLIEVDMYKNWFPYTFGMGLKTCQELKEVDMLKKVAYMTIGLPWPMSDRDICVYGYGADMLDEGRILCVVRSYDSPPHLGDKETPADTKESEKPEAKDASKDGAKAADATAPQPSFINILDTLDQKIDVPKPGKFTRVTMSCGGFLLKPIDPNNTYVALLLNIDPKMAVIPPALLNWGMKQLSHMAFGLLKTYAKSVESKDSPYVKRMEEKKELYGFLKRRYAEYLETQKKADGAAAETSATAAKPS